MDTLLVYVSKTGVTESVAQDIIAGYQDSIDTFNLYSVTPDNLNEYDTVIIGAPTYMGRAHKKMRKWVKDNEPLLKNKKLFFFIVGANETVDVHEVLHASYPSDLVDCAQGKTHCGGAYRFNRMNKISRLIINKIIKEEQKKNPGSSLPSVDEEAIKALVKALQQS